MPATFTKVARGRELGAFIVGLLCALVLFIMVLIHYYKAYPAFCHRPHQDASKSDEIEMQQEDDDKNDDKNDEKNEDQTSVNIKSIYNRELREDSSTLALLSCFAMLFYFLSQFYDALIKAASEDLAFCTGFILPIVWSFTMGRGLQFTLYLARLDYLYGNHPDIGYKKSTLMILATLVAVFVLILLSLEAAYGLQGEIFYDFEDFPYFCSFRMPEYILAILLVYDIVFSITSITLFWIPLGKIKENKETETQQQLTSYGFKYAMIVSFNAVIVVANLLLIVLTGLTITAPLMNIVGTVAVMLLSPYYPKLSAASGIATIDELAQKLKTK